MQGMPKHLARAAAVMLGLAACAVHAVDFAVPVEGSGIMPQVKSIRVTCTTFGSTGLTGPRGSHFVAVSDGTVNQTVVIKVDIPMGGLKLIGYSCAVDRIFDIDVTKLNPIPKEYLQEHMSKGAPAKDMHLQANSVVNVEGKL